MRKILILLLTAVLALCSFSTASAEELSRPWELMNDFVKAHPHRLSGTEEGKEAGEYIKGFFESVGYQTEEQRFSFEKSISMTDYEVVEDRNIIAKADNASRYTVIIGAHYDNVFSTGAGEGAYDNGSGVGVLLALAESLFGKVLDYNIVFVAFGGEESGLYGSRYYLEGLSPMERDSIVLYINIDSISAGDNLYIYCDEVETLHEKYFLDLAYSMSLNIHPLPDYKKAPSVYNYGDKLPYSHAGLATDTATFFNAGIMTVGFSSYTIDRQELEQVNESLTHENIMHTPNDNVEKIERLYGDSAREKVDAVYTLLFSALTKEGFISDMVYAKVNNPDYSLLANGTLPALLSIAIIALAVLALCISISICKQKSKKTKQSEENTPRPPEVFGDF